jgi:TolB-like protein/Tfp pilus assembly protein PilF
VTGVVFVLLLSAGVWIVRPRVASPPAIESIAVLPFDEVGEQGSDPYFADGLTDALITTLAASDRVRVISRTSILPFRRPHPPLPAIAGQLGVRTFVEGTVQRSANRIRITARLIDAATDRHLWAKSYERSIGDLFLLQEELGRDISAEIGQALGPRVSPSRAAYSLSPDAIDLYLRGRAQWAKRTESGLAESLTLFRRALDLEPSFARAYSGLADAYASLGYLGYLRPTDSFEPAETAARRALDIDSTLAEAHASFGFVQLYYRWNWSDAEREFDRAIRLNPGYAPAYQWQSVYLAAMGRLHEAAATIERARHRDPLSLAVATDIGWQKYLRRDYRAAHVQLASVTMVDRTFPLGHFWLGRTLTEQGRHDEAIRELSRAVELLNRSPVSLVQLAHAHAVAGRHERARELLAELHETSRSRYVPAYGIALIQIGLGEYELGLRWLERAVDERSNWLVWLKLDPRWDPIRQDPRFKVIVRRVGLR